MSPKVEFTLKTWPVVTTLTIGLCYLTEAVAGGLGITLSEQANLDLVRQAAGWNLNFLLLLAQVLAIMPLLEELLFRGLLFALPVRLLHAGTRTLLALASVSSALFSAAHYLMAPFPDNAFLALFGFGIAQCWLYRKTSSIWCAVLNHALFNLTNLVLLFALPE